jgi:hypothetical protein
MVTINFWEGRGCRRAKQTKACALRVEFSERLRLRKTATKPAEFRSLNRGTQLYSIIKVIVNFDSDILYKVIN